MRVDAFLIAFREALEAFLIIGIILSYLHRVKRPELGRWVWAGTVAAALSSLVIAFLLQVVFLSFTMMNAEVYLKVGIMFFASLMLAYMVFWMAEQSRGIRSELEQEIDRHLTAGNFLGLVSLAYFGVLREGIETVFFFAAIGHGDIGAAMASWGALAGFALAGFLCWLMFRSAVRVPLKTFFKVSGVLLLLIAAGLFTQGVSILQDLEILGSLNPKVYDITWFMPEHPVDEQHFIRDTGQHPLIPSQVGVFFKALFGYSAAPSIEEIIAYFGFYALILAGFRLRAAWERRRASKGASKQEESLAPAEPRTAP